MAYVAPVIKVAYPRTCTVVFGALVVLLLSHFLSSQSWLRALRFAVIFGVVIGLLQAFQWYRERQRRK